MKSQIKIKNFRILEDITIDLRATTFLLGPNGSGKSTLIKALFFLAKNCHINPSDYKIKYDFPYNNIKLRSFYDIVSNADVEKKINFEFNYVNKFSSLNKIPVYCLQEILPLFPDKHDKVKYTIDRCENSSRQNKIRKNVYQLSKTNSYNSLIEFFKQANVAELVKLFIQVNNVIDFKLTFEFKKNSLEKLLKFSFSEFDIEIIDNKETRNAHYEKIIGISDEVLWQPNYKVKSKFDKFFKIEQELYEKIIEDLEVKLKFNENKLTFNGIAIKVKSILEELNENSNNEVISKEARKIFLKGVLFYYQISILFTEIFINSLVHYNFSGIREMPKYTYPLINSEFDKSDYYSLLRSIPTKQEGMDYLDDHDNLYNLIARDINLSHLSDILKKMNFGKMIYTTKSHDYGKIKLLTLNDEEIDLINASSGLLQSFPIIIKLLSYYLFPQEYKPRISIEQPELHLHPKMQTKFMEFLIGGNLIIETHSEHIIKKIQVMFAQGKVSDRDIVINYFDKDDEGKIIIKKMEIDKYGFFKEPWPDGFFDETYNLTEELLLATKRN